MFCPFRNDKCVIKDSKQSWICIFEDTELKTCRLKILIDKAFEVGKEFEKNKGAASPLSAIAAVFALLGKGK